MRRLSFSMILAVVLGMTAAVNASTFNRYPVNSSDSEASRTSLLAAKTNSGSFVPVEHPTQGQVNIIEEDGIKYLELSSDFQTDRGPALEIILHNSPTVGLQIQEGEYVSLGELKAFNGSQRYQLPQDLNLDQYQSVAIWCEEFNATFGYATLK